MNIIVRILIVFMSIVHLNNELTARLRRTASVGLGDGERRDLEERSRVERVPRSSVNPQAAASTRRRRCIFERAQPAHFPFVLVVLLGCTGSGRT